jgi:hypothetical protein
LKANAVKYKGSTKAIKAGSKGQKESEAISSFSIKSYATESEEK